MTADCPVGVVLHLANLDDTPLRIGRGETEAGEGAAVGKGDGSDLGGAGAQICAAAWDLCRCHSLRHRSTMRGAVDPHAGCRRPLPSRSGRLGVAFSGASKETNRVSNPFSWARLTTPSRRQGIFCSEVSFLRVHAGLLGSISAVECREWRRGGRGLRDRRVRRRSTARRRYRRNTIARETRFPPVNGRCARRDAANRCRPGKSAPTRLSC